MNRRVRGGLGFCVCLVVLFSFLASISFFVVPVHAITTYLSDDFESFTTGWTLGTTNGGTVTKSSTTAHGGTYSGKFYSVASTATAYATRGFTQTTGDHRYSIWFYLDSSYTGFSNFMIGELYDGTSKYSMICSILYHDSAYWLQNANTSWVDVCTVSADVWHHLEVYYNYTSGKLHYYLDSIKQGGDWGSYSNSASIKPKTIYIGDVANDPGITNGFAYFDDLAIDDTAEPLADSTPPTYSGINTNTTIRNMPCNFSVTLSDETALANYTFGTNNTGTWTNESAVTISGLSYKANTTKTLNNTVGVVVQWEYWFADSSNNLNNTGIQSLTVTAYVQTNTFSETTNASDGLQTLGTFTLIDYITNLLEVTPSMLNASTQSALEAYAIGNITMAQLQTYVDSLPNSNLDGGGAWDSVSAFYILQVEKQCAKLDGFVQNATTINWALNNITMMANGLPKDYIFEGIEAYMVYDRYVWYWYQWATDNGGNTTKWNLVKAFNSLEYAVFHSSVPAVLYIKNDNTTWIGSGRYYDEAAETMDCFLQIYALNSPLLNNTQVLADAKTVWAWIINNEWHTDHFGYYVTNDDWECEAGGFLQLAFKLLYYDSNTPNIALALTDIANRFLAESWYSPQWTLNANGTDSAFVVTHAGYGINTVRRLENTLMAWSAIYAIYGNLTASQQANVTKMLQGYTDGTGTYKPAWEYLYDPAANLYDTASGQFKMQSDSGYGAGSDAMALSLLTYFGIVPQTGVLAIPILEDKYEDVSNLYDRDLFALDIPNRVLTMSVVTGGIFMFQYGGVPFNCTLALQGIYNVTFASDWNSITSSVKLSELPSDRLFFLHVPKALDFLTSGIINLFSSLSKAVGLGFQPPVSIVLSSTDYFWKALPFQVTGAINLYESTTIYKALGFLTSGIVNGFSSIQKSIALAFQSTGTIKLYDASTILKALGFQTTNTLHVSDSSTMQKAIGFLTTVATNIYASISKAMELAFTPTGILHIFAYGTSGKETATILVDRFELAKLFSILSFNMAKGFSNYDLIQPSANIMQNKAIQFGVFDGLIRLFSDASIGIGRIFSNFETINPFAFLSIGKELNFNIYGLPQFIDNLSMAKSIRVTFFELSGLIQPFISTLTSFQITVIAPVSNPAFVLAAFAIILAIVAISLVLVHRRPEDED